MSFNSDDAATRHCEPPAGDGASCSAGRPHKRRWLFGTALAAIALLALLVVGSAFALSPWPARRTALPRPNWAQAVRRDVARTVTATGEVRLRIGSTVRVGAQLSGIVERLNVSVGSRVSRGDIIAQIDSRPVWARVDQKRALVLRDQLLAAKAKMDLGRLSALASRGWVSAQKLDDARAEAADALATLRASREDWNAARVDLHYVTIRAPISGIVASVSTQAGETVAASFATPNFVTIIQPHSLEVIALVDEADIGDVRLGEPASFTVDSWPDREFQGRVTRIAPIATTVSGVVDYEVAIQIDGDGAGLKPSMTADVSITTSRSSFVSIPAGAIRRTSEGALVEVRSATGSPTLRRVRAGAVRSGMVEVLEGLAPGEWVLVNNGVKQ